jgi:hypothetical protein
VPWLLPIAQAAVLNDNSGGKVNRKGFRAQGTGFREEKTGYREKNFELPVVNNELWEWAAAFS